MTKTKNKEPEFFDLTAAFNITKDTVPVKFGPGVIHVKFWESDEMKKIQKAVLKPYRNEIRSNVLNEKTAMRLNAEIVSRGAIPHWEKIGFDGELKECNEENVYTACLKLPGFLKTVMGVSQDESNYRADDIEAEGN